jgi:hypothetical protein
MDSKLLPEKLTFNTTGEIPESAITTPIAPEQQRQATHRLFAEIDQWLHNENK